LKQLEVVEAEKDATYRASTQIQTAARPRRFRCQRQYVQDRHRLYGFNRAEPRSVMVAKLVTAVYLLKLSSEHNRADYACRALDDFVKSVISTMRTGRSGQWNRLCFEACAPNERQNIVPAIVQTRINFQHDEDILGLGSYLLLCLTRADEGLFGQTVAPRNAGYDVGKPWKRPCW
jgi:hypothetical protein